MATSGKKQSPSSHPARELTNRQCTGIIVLLVAVFFKDFLLGNAYFWEDFLHYCYPVRNFAATAMAGGEFPLWNPYTFNGMPFFADIQTNVLYLPSAVLALFVRDGILQYYWLQLMIILHFVLAGVTMFHLGRSFGLRSLPSLFAGVAYMLCGFMIVHAIHQQMVTMAAWFPLILLSFRNALTMTGWSRVFIAGAILGHSIFAGFPQLSLFLYFFLLLVFLFEFGTSFKGAGMVSRDAGVFALKAMAVIVLSIGIAAVQLLPTMELGELSQRAAITYEKSNEGQLSWAHFLTMAFPKLFGVADASAYNYWGPGVYWYYWETAIYRGALPFLLTICSVLLWKKHRYIPFLFGVSLFALLFSLGGNFFLHRLFFEYLPGFSTFRSPGRMGIFLSLAGALLAGFSLQHLLYEDRERNAKRWQTVILIVTGVVALVWYLLVSGTAGFAFLQNPAILPAVSKEAHISLGIFILSAILLLAVVRGTRSRGMGLAFIAVLFIDMFLFGGGQNSSRTNPGEHFQRAPALRQFLREEGRKEVFRVNSRNEQGMLMDRNQGMIDRIFLMEGYTPLALQRAYPPLADGDRLHDLLNVKFKTVTNDAQRALSLVPRTSYLPRAFFKYEYRVIPDSNDLVAYMNSPGYDHRRVAVLEKQPHRSWTPQSPDPEWKAQITAYHDNSIAIDVQTGGDGLLVLSEMYYPGWKASVDGNETEIYRTDFNLRGIVVEKGAHTVEFRFQPESFARGTAISLSTLVLCLGGIIVSTVRQKRRDTTA